MTCNQKRRCRKIGSRKKSGHNQIIQNKGTSVMESGQAAEVAADPGPAQISET